MITSKMSLGKLNSYVLQCPIIHQPVKVNEWKQLSIPGGQATWWHCPECLNWHVLVGGGPEPYLSRPNHELCTVAG
jgi:hypothetical protein